MQIQWNGRSDTDKSPLVIASGASGSIVFRHGINVGISDAQWAAAGAQPVVKRYVKSGNLGVVPPIAKVPAASPIAPPSAELKMVAETTDRALLAKWREENPGLHTAIDAQLAKLPASTTATK